MTIAGESAGGMSVSSLMTMPAARGLFRRAIPQSGAGHNGLGVETASMIGGHMLDILGVAPGDLDALLRVPNEILLDTQVKLGDELQTTRDPARFGEAAASAMAFQPTYGTEALPQRPIDAIAAGAAADIDLMIGTTRDEALIFIVDLKDIFNEELVAMTVDAVFGMAGRDGSAVLDVYRSNRPDAEPHKIAAAIESDRMFVVPAIRMADAQAAYNPNTRLYRFDWQADVAWGAHHFIEVPFAFDQLDNPQARGFSGDDPPRSLSAATHAAWVGFVRDGDPNHEGLPEWPRYDAETRPTMLFNDTCSVENRPADDEVSLWEGVV